MDIIGNYTLKNGKELILFRPGSEYAEMVVEFIRTVNEESPFLGRDSRDKQLSVDEMREKLSAEQKSERAVFLAGMIGDEMVVESFVRPVNNRARFAHRSLFGIVVLKKYWGIGIGRIATTECISISKKCGYEQLELNTIVGNNAAMDLYLDLGFEIIGMTRNAMKYADRSYADEYLMVNYFKIGT